MKKIKLLITSFVLAFSFVGVPILVASTVGASPASQVQTGVNKIGGGGQKLMPKIKTIVNVLLFVLGAVAVIMIVIGGIRYVVSGGESSAVTGAKNTILYAVIGLVVAVLAYAIVNFVLDAFK